MAIGNEDAALRVAAYVDDELDAIARARFEREMAADPALRSEVDAQRALRDRIVGHFAPVADEPVPDRLRALLTGGGEAEVIDLNAARARREQRRRLPSWGNFGAIAATLAVGIIAGQMVDLSGSPVASRDGQLVAHGGLERALDVQLASAQPQDAQVRIGVTFRDTGGALCRSFDSADLAGIACRAGDDWRLRQTFAVESAGGATQYRQAGSGDAAVMQAAQTMMAGAPLDAEAERRARDAGWR